MAEVKSAVVKKTEPVQNKDPEKLENMRARDAEMVKGIFKFYEVPGGKLTFFYKAYKPDPIERYEMNDGEVYTIPLGVAKHLNRNCWYPVHEHEIDEHGKASTRIGKKVQRFYFQSLEFVDIEDLNLPDGQLIIR